MLQSLLYHKGLPFSTVLMDSWYGTKKLMRSIDNLGKIYYCPLKKNRLIDDTGGMEDYKPIESLPWTQSELEQGFDY